MRKSIGREGREGRRDEWEEWEGGMSGKRGKIGASKIECWGWEDGWMGG
jgi:hypothetical protein